LTSIAGSKKMARGDCDGRQKTKTPASAGVRKGGLLLSF
jgi:hypothetical protein